jgi:hypothetical protein
MSSNYWKNKEKEDRRREGMYDAIRKGDYDRATHEASPDAYLDYLRLKNPQDVQQPNTFTHQIAADLTEERKNLLELIECTRLDIHGRIKLIQMVHAIDLSSPGAREKMDQIRRQMEGYM